MTDNTHEPTPEFTRFLEWQVASALRRRDRFARPAFVTAGPRRHLATAAIAVVSLVAGAGVVTASARIQGNQARQTVIEQQQGEIGVAQLQLSVVKKEAEDAQRRASLGVISQAQAAELQQRVDELAVKLQQMALSLEEVKASGQPAQDEITSPLVGGRDFVSERLKLQLRIASLAADASARELSRAERRVEVGLMPQEQLMDLQTAADRSAGDVRLVQQELELRQRFLSGKLTAKDVARERSAAAMRIEIRSAELGLQAANARYARARRMVKFGLLTEVDALKAQVQVLELEKDLKALRAQLQMLESGGGQ